MRNIILLFSVILFISCAGTGAVVSTVKKDVITGEESLTTSEAALNNSMTEKIGTNIILLSGLKHDESRVLMFNMRRVLTTNIGGGIDKHSLVYIKTSDDEIYELEAVSSVTPNISYGSYGINTWSIVSAYEVPDDIFNKLLSSQVVFIRVDTNEGHLDSPISENYAPRFNEVLMQLK